LNYEIAGGFGVTGGGFVNLGVAFGYSIDELSIVDQLVNSLNNKNVEVFGNLINQIRYVKS